MNTFAGTEAVGVAVGWGAAVAVGSLGTAVAATVDSVALETIEDGDPPQAASNPAKRIRARTQRIRSIGIQDTQATALCQTSSRIGNTA